MEAPLAHILDTWLRGLQPLQVLDDASVLVAAARARAMATERGLSSAQREAFVTAVLELARNQVHHAYGGWIDFREIERDGVPGVEAVLADGGRGIEELGRALREDPASPTGLGAGLAGAYRLADEMDIDVRLGEGSCLHVRKFQTAPARRREVAILGAAMPGSTPSGDHAAFVRDGERLKLIVVDGVGHGAAARQAADRAVAAFFAAAPGEPVEALVRRCDAALKGSRGAALWTAAVGEEPGRREVEHVAVGNIEARVIGLNGRSIGGRALGAVGVMQRPGPRHLHVERTPLAVGDAVAAYSDGISSRVTLSPSSVVLPAAQLAVELFAQRRGDDDALVLVAK